MHYNRIRHRTTKLNMNNHLNFNDKVALVTGASSGMGLATAQAFAEAGASVALVDVKEEAVRQSVEKLVSEGHRAIAIRCDVSKDAQVEAMVERTVAEFGRLDAAFNNAGVMAKNALTADSTLEEFDRVIGVDLRGVWSCMKHELRQMERQGSGAIVNCSSIGGLRGDRGIPSYTASKHGVIGLTRAAALEYAAKGIRVNAVCRARSTRRLPAQRSRTRKNSRLCQNPCPSAGSASQRRSRRLWFGCAAREQATWLGTPWSSTVGRRWGLVSCPANCRQLKPKDKLMKSSSKNARADGPVCWNHNLLPHAALEAATRSHNSIR